MVDSAMRDITMGGILAVCTGMVEEILGVKLWLFAIAFILSIFGSISHWWAHNLKRDFSQEPFRPTYFIGVIWIGLFGGLSVFTTMIYYGQPVLLVLLATTVSSYMSTEVLFRIERGIKRRLDKEIDKLGGGKDEHHD